VISRWQIPRSIAALIFSWTSLIAQPVAALVIDDFSDGAIASTITTGSYVSVTPATVLGGKRFVAAVITSNPLDRDVDVAVTPGLFALDTGTLTGAFGQLGYGIDTFTGPGMTTYLDLNVDLTVLGDRIRLEFASNDLPQSVDLLLYNNLQSGVGVLGSVQTALVAGNQFATFFVDFPFSGVNGGVDLTTIDQIGVNFNFKGEPSRDFALHSISIVPEPSTLSIVGLGIAMLGRRRLR